MRTAEFLIPYPRELTSEQIHRDATMPEVMAAQEQSYKYGLLAHAALRNERDAIEPLLPSIWEYEIANSFDSLEVALLSTPGGWEYRNEVNFHALNSPLLEMWTPLIEGEWPNGKARNMSFHGAINTLALEGLVYYAHREKFIRQHGTEVLYEDSEMEAFLRRYNGALQEIDIALVTLEAVRQRPELTVIPAPLQFERDAHRANADLLVVDTVNEYAVGVQAKTLVSNDATRRYDPERVVLVDGSTDLGNVRVVRVNRKRSTELVKPWPGIVAASCVHNIPLNGKNQYVPAQYVSHLLRSKMMARELVGGLRVEHKKLAALVGERILRKLYGPDMQPA